MSSMNNLTSSYGSLSQSKEAAQLYEETMALRGDLTGTNES